MRVQPVEDVHKLAGELERRLKDTLCVVNLRQGQDELAQARLEVEQVYVDDRVPTTRTLRVVGRTPGGRDHGAVAIPLAGPMSGQWTEASGRVDLIQGGYILSIIPAPGAREGHADRKSLARV
ncbi:hypothetical protein [Limnochorda pilosa]|uniref:Uncharacterized protein n=1 Tax=Limnochorda pilosa TaxID=1555112 RepID=A0A0K2SG45_LIMPI|nr:hypothetical protein [Limnochorda pilosa]BAS26012.1 hypothetical protein LIP_0155 [Limnochorda pilosa]